MVSQTDKSISETAYILLGFLNVDHRSRSIGLNLNFDPLTLNRRKSRVLSLLHLFSVESVTDYTNEEVEE